MSEDVSNYLFRVAGGAAEPAAEPEPERAEWTSAYINDLPDSSFLYIAPGGSKDADGKTVPRSLRYFPVKDAGGNVDLPHLRNALARIPQSNLPQSVKDSAIAKAQRMLSNAQGDGRSEELEGGEAVYRVLEPDALRYVEDADGGPMLEGRMMPYNEWAEINSPIEGHFLERFAPGALAKTMAEQASRVKVLFEHGMDRLGKQPIATISEMWEDDGGADYRARLLRGLPELLVEGLRNNVYGTSIRFVPVKWDRRRSVTPSETNPDGLPEHTVKEARLREFSVVTFPAYVGATASVRSLTDEVAAKQLLGDPERLLEYIASRREPPHSEPEPGEEPASELPSRSTRPARDYLNPREGVPQWRL